MRIDVVLQEPVGNNHVHPGRLDELGDFDAFRSLGRVTLGEICFASTFTTASSHVA